MQKLKSKIAFLSKNVSDEELNFLSKSIGVNQDGVRYPLLWGGGFGVNRRRGASRANKGGGKARPDQRLV